MSKTSYTEHEIMALIFLGVLMGLLVMLGISQMTIDIQADVPELGQAICEEEYGMDYKYYSGEELTCQPKEGQKDNYDGIIVKGV